MCVMCGVLYDSIAMLLQSNVCDVLYDSIVMLFQSNVCDVLYDSIDVPMYVCGVSKCVFTCMVCESV